MIIFIKKLLKTTFSAHFFNLMKYITLYFWFKVQNKDSQLVLVSGFKIQLKSLVEY